MEKGNILGGFLRGLIDLIKLIIEAIFFVIKSFISSFKDMWRGMR